MATCTKPECPGNQEGRAHGHLSMPDPCPHVSRIDIIRARLSQSEDLDNLRDHIRACPERSDA